MRPLHATHGVGSLFDDGKVVQCRYNTMIRDRSDSTRVENYSCEHLNSLLVEFSME